MVCEKCTTKLSKLATIKKDHGGSKVTNENKLLSSKQKFKADRDQYKKCRICGHLTHHVHSHYCQPCAYQKGICAMCGRKVIETKNYKQTAV
ncbi:cysteine-rich PDZ-binding protein-like protein [Aphelenchoides avenae]|nr:cysteine-rich PDZ-binding protein-like protein [Aphelenchus avenae]